MFFLSDPTWFYKVSASLDLFVQVKCVSHSNVELKRSQKDVDWKQLLPSIFRNPWPLEMVDPQSQNAPHHRIPNASLDDWVDEKNALKCTETGRSKTSEPRKPKNCWWVSTSFLPKPLPFCPSFSINTIVVRLDLLRWIRWIWGGGMAWMSMFRIDLPQNNRNNEWKNDNLPTGIYFNNFMQTFHTNSRD